MDDTIATEAREDDVLDQADADEARVGGSAAPSAELEDRGYVFQDLGPEVRQRADREGSACARTHRVGRRAAPAGGGGGASRARASGV